MAVSNATLLAKISALEARVTALAAKVKADETSYNTKFTALNPLIVAGSSQNTFLANINVMTTPGTYPLGTDGSSGSYWASGERDFVNGSSNMDNLIVQKLQRAGLMTP